MNKLMAVMLVFLCALGCVMWSVDAWAKAPVKKPVTAKIIKPKPKPKTKPIIPVIKKVNPKDGAQLVLIPAGEFLMGTTDEELDALLKENPKFKRFGFVNELSQRKVNLDAYYIYKTEVTVAQYRKFCKAAKRKMPNASSWKMLDNQPIMNVSWNDANAYAKWAGAALPTEAQWEKAARGTDARIYPWGNDGDTSKCCNYSNAKAPAAVGSFPKGDSPYGVQDMAGNVFEWCADWYAEEYYLTAPAKNPTGPATGTVRVMRGGSWVNNLGTLRSAGRDIFSPDLFSNYLGFRCAVSYP